MVAVCDSLDSEGTFGRRHQVQLQASPCNERLYVSRVRRRSRPGPGRAAGFEEDTQSARPYWGWSIRRGLASCPVGVSRWLVASWLCRISLAARRASGLHASLTPSNGRVRAAKVSRVEKWVV
jgi:hypothetical protein